MDDPKDDQVRVDMTVEQIRNGIATLRKDRDHMLELELFDESIAHGEHLILAKRAYEQLEKRLTTKTLGGAT